MIVRAKTFEQWMRANLDMGQIKDLARHGADAGWPGLTYYSDTCKLYDRFTDEIWTALDEDAREQGMGILEMIAGFSGGWETASGEGLKNLLVWYMAERTARGIAEAH